MLKTWHVPKDIGNHRLLRWYTRCAVRHSLLCREAMSWGAVSKAYAEGREAAHYAGLILGYTEQAGLTLAMFSMEIRTAVAAVDPVDGTSTS